VTQTIETDRIRRIQDKVRAEVRPHDEPVGEGLVWPWPRVGLFAGSWGRSGNRAWHRPELSALSKRCATNGD
jgi:hypothetical protein